MEGCTVTDLKVHSRENCFVLDAATMQRIQEETSVSTTLEPGTYIVRIRSGSFNYRSNIPQSGEALVMFWIYGGRFLRDVFVLVDELDYCVGKLVEDGVQFYEEYDRRLETFVEGNYVLCRHGLVNLLNPVKPWITPSR